MDSYRVENCFLLHEKYFFFRKRFEIKYSKFCFDLCVTFDSASRYSLVKLNQAKLGSVKLQGMDRVMMGGTVIGT